MVAVKTVDIRNDFKSISNMISSGEIVLVSRPHNQNLVILAESEYNELEKARKNSNYLKKLELSHNQIKEGRIITKSIEELEAMEL